MIYFNGYIFRYELISIVSDVRKLKGTGRKKTGLFIFSVKCDGNEIVFNYDTREDAEEDHMALTSQVLDYEPQNLMREEE